MFGFKIRYITGKKNVITDILFRKLKSFLNIIDN
jgi:hypothetical protein